MSLVIARSDGGFYAGTSQKKAIWTREKENAAEFRSRAEAEVRKTGLEKAEASGRTFKIEEGV